VEPTQRWATDFDVAVVTQFSLALRAAFLPARTVVNRLGTRNGLLPLVAPYLRASRREAELQTSWQQSLYQQLPSAPFLVSRNRDICCYDLYLYMLLRRLLCPRWHLLHHHPARLPWSRSTVAGQGHYVRPESLRM
jgi:hypothetical protein